MTEFWIVTVLLVVAIGIGVPIAFGIGLITLLYMLMTNPQNIAVIPLRMFSSVDSFILMAIPLFVLAAEIMVKTNISGKLFDFVKIFFGRFRGGLAYVNIVAGTIFGAISGAALSDVAALGRIEIDAMIEDGYQKDFSCAITASSSMEAPLIPPSNIAVIYGGIMSLSIGALFLAGFLPGLLLTCSQLLYIKFMGKKMNLPKHTEKYTKQELIRITKDGMYSLLMPVIILGGILSGIATPTEAAGMAVFYALIVGIFIFHTVKLKDIIDSLWSAAKITANLFLIIACSAAFTWTLGAEQIPDKIAALMLKLTNNPYILLMIINVILVVIGMWMETGAAVILFAPILAPVMYEVGVHPIQFAMVMIVNLTIGLLTPPVGVVLYAVASVGKEKFERVVQATLPLIGMAFVVQLLVTFFPEISLFLPRLFHMI
jgi:tripartite ATP-independent transporter DctM subunit